MVPGVYNNLKRSAKHWGIKVTEDGLAHLNIPMILQVLNKLSNKFEKGYILFIMWNVKCANIF